MKNKQRRFGASVVLISCMVIGMLLAMQVVPNVVYRNWNIVSAEGNPGTGKSGLLEIFIYPHQGTPATAYAANLTEGASYAYRTSFNGSCTGNVPYATLFDIVVKARFNATHCYNTTGSVWMLTWCKALLTSANLAISADTLMTAVKIGSNATYMWVNFWIADSDGGAGSGFTITHGQIVNCTSLKLQAYY